MASRVGVNLRASAYLHQGDRKYMEDEFQVAYQRTKDKKDIEYAFFGIFDGHGGKEAAHFAKDNLMDNIVSQRNFWSDNDEDILSAIKEGFLQTHLAMWKVLDQWPRTASGWPSTSGTTASIAFIRRQKIYIGHVGDSGIVLGYGLDDNEWVGESLTRDHKPESILEMNRITECGGKVVAKSGVPRVVWNRPKSGHQGPVRRSTPMDEIPFLAVARSLGDLWSYNAINDRFVVSPEPDVFVKKINIDIHRCLIFGTDGLWNALSPSTAVNIAYCTEKNNEKHYLGIPMYSGKARLWINPSRSIVTGALTRYQNVNLRADNTSAVTVFLDPPGHPKREVLLSQYALKKGSPVKNNQNKTVTRKLNKEAAVQVHVYNQIPNGKERSAGMFRIKERIPVSGCSSDADSDNDQTKLPPFYQESLVKEKALLSSREEDMIDKKYHFPSCSEYGCNLKASLLPYSEDTCPDTANKWHDPSNQFNNGDIIQSPEVSSSTMVEGTENTSHGPINSDSTPGKRRRTRSSQVIVKSENKRGHSSKNKLPIRSNGVSSKMRKRGRGLLATASSATSRILKSVNRGEKSAPTFMTRKRKRSVDRSDEERNPKIVRVNTRSHTLSSKSMTTRSQDRIKKRVLL